MSSKNNKDESGNFVAAYNNDSIKFSFVLILSEILSIKLN